MNGATGIRTKRKREIDEMTDEMIERDNLVMNQAQEIDNLRHELERVKGIASRRLDRIAQLQRDKADLEALADNRLERIMNLLGAIDAKDFKTIHKDNELAAAVDPEQARVELGREPRSHLENELADLRASAFRSADAAQYIINYCR